MSVRETLLQSYRTWAKNTLGLSDSQVILAQREDTAYRPPLPFLMVHFLSLDRTVGVDETWVTTNNAGDVVKKTRGNRQATLQLSAFGFDSEDWLTELAMRVDEYEGPSTIVNQGQMIDVSALISTSLESQFIADFVVEYRVEIEIVDPGLAAESIEVDAPQHNKTITVSLI